MKTNHLFASAAIAAVLAMASPAQAQLLGGGARGGAGGALGGAFGPGAGDLRGNMTASMNSEAGGHVNGRADRTVGRADRTVKGDAQGAAARAGQQAHQGAGEFVASGVTDARQGDSVAARTTNATAASATDGTARAAGQSQTPAREVDAGLSGALSASGAANGEAGMTNTRQPAVRPAGHPESTGGASRHQTGASENAPRARSDKPAGGNHKPHQAPMPANGDVSASASANSSADIPNANFGMSCRAQQIDSHIED